MTLNWFHDFLNSRCIPNLLVLIMLLLVLLPIAFGVPQESMIWSLLFILYINDIATSNLTNFIIFVDNTIIFFKDKDLKCLYYKYKTSKNIKMV